MDVQHACGSSIWVPARHAYEEPKAGLTALNAVGNRPHHCRLTADDRPLDLSRPNINISSLLDTAPLPGLGAGPHKSAFTPFLGAGSGRRTE